MGVIKKFFILEKTIEATLEKSSDDKCSGIANVFTFQSTTNKRGKIKVVAICISVRTENTSPICKIIHASIFTDGFLNLEKLYSFLMKNTFYQ